MRHTSNKELSLLLDKHCHERFATAPRGKGPPTPFQITPAMGWVCRALPTTPPSTVRQKSGIGKKHRQ